MKEDFLHYIWQHQYFDKSALQTADGQSLQIIRPGFHNHDAGPDFGEARLQIGEVSWSGCVEIHLRASDWLRHNHHADTRYDQVVLHVVWDNDADICRTDKTAIPALTLKERVKPEYRQAYESLSHNPDYIPCSAFFVRVPALNKTMMFERALVERLEHKATFVAELYTQNSYDWETTTYHLLALSFGFKINQEGFRALAKALPYGVVRKYRHNLFQLEALVFGQAGFLEELPTENDTYLQKLRAEFNYLRHKHRLEDQTMTTGRWNFLRLRPANFPTVRLAQFAALLHQQEYLFSGLLDCKNLAAYTAFFKARPSEYWQLHYMPGRSAAKPLPQMGTGSINSLVINTVVPLWAAYARLRDENAFMERAIDLLEQLPKENNNITREYEALGYTNKTAADSQAILSLYRQYCQPRRCLHCVIGNAIIKHSQAFS